MFALASCRPTYQVAHQDVYNQQVHLESVDTTWQNIDRIIQPYRSQFEDKINEVIGHVDQALEKERPESTLGNFLADGLLEYSKKMTDLDVSFACLNYGGVRLNSIPVGPLTVEKIYEVMPFDNLLVILPLSGSEVTQLCNHIAANGGWPVSKGISFRIEKEGAAADVLIGGKPIDAAKTYHVALPDYVANGGNRSYFLEDIDPIDTEVVLIRDALIELSRSRMNAGMPISVQLENRIINTPTNE